MLGTSFALGEYVQREKTFAALLPVELSRQTARKIELYNEAMIWETPHAISLRFNEVLAAQPDMILWVMTPWDIERAPILLPPPDAPKSRSLLAGAKELMSQSRTRALLESLLFQSHISSFSRILIGHNDLGPFKVKRSPPWQSYLSDFDSYDADIERQAKAAGVPLVVVLVPSRTQAAMLSLSDWNADYNPYMLGDDLRLIVTRHGGTYIDILHSFSSIHNAGQYYTLTQPHPDADGHAIIAELISKQLTSGAVPALSGSTPVLSAKENGR
jgi:hypothetical protein